MLPTHSDYDAIVKARVPAKPKTPLTSANCSLPYEVLDSQDKMELKASHKTVEEMDLFFLCFSVLSMFLVVAPDFGCTMRAERAATVRIGVD